jgi:hypothetical protein
MERHLPVNNRFQFDLSSFSTDIQLVICVAVALVLKDKN